MTWKTQKATENRRFTQWFNKPAFGNLLSAAPQKEAESLNIPKMKQTTWAKITPLEKTNI